MAIFKTVHIFSAGANGWSELWYQERSTIIECIEPAKNVAGKRQLLLGTGVKLTHLRISSVDKPRKSHIQRVALDWNSSLGVADTAWNTVLARLSTADREHHRVTQLRGVPDDWIIRQALTGEFDVDVAPISTPLTNFVQSLHQNGHRFKSRGTAGAAGTFSAVTLFGKEAVTNRLTANVAALAVAPGDFVTFSEVTGFGAADAVRGRHKVVINDGAKLTLQTVVPAAVEPAAWSAGKVRPATPVYLLPMFAVPINVSHRDTGRRFFVTRGRRSKRKA